MLGLAELGAAHTDAPSTNVPCYPVTTRHMELFPFPCVPGLFVVKIPFPLGSFFSTSKSHIYNRNCLQLCQSHFKAAGKLTLKSTFSTIFSCHKDIAVRLANPFTRRLNFHFCVKSYYRFPLCHGITFKHDFAEYSIP